MSNKANVSEPIACASCSSLRYEENAMYATDVQNDIFTLADGLRNDLGVINFHSG